MKRFTRLAAVPLMFVASALMGAAVPVRVPFETPVTVHVKSDVSSARAQPGDTVVLQLAEDVISGGYVVMAKGADGLAVVDSVVSATSNAPGRVNLTFKWVRAVDGSKIGVTGQHSATGRSGSSAADVTSTLNDSSSIASNAGAYQSSGILGRASGILGTIGAHAKQSDASVTTDRTISLEVRNPNGVVILSSQKATSPANDDSDVK